MFCPIIILTDKKNERDEANKKDNEYNERDHLMNNNKIHLLDDDGNCE